MSVVDQERRALRVQTACLALILVMTSPHIAGAAEWNVVKVAENGSKTCRRPMATGLYDAEAGRVYACWSGPGMRPQVAAFDPGIKKVLAARGIGAPEGSQDYHDYPHIIQSSDGILHVFYSRHNESLHQMIGPNAHAIDGEWQAREIGRKLKATYPMPIADSQGALYVFYRVSKDTDYRPMAYVKSIDNGRTWSQPVPAIDHGRTRRADHLDEIYVGALTPAFPKGLGELFHCTWTLAGGGPEKHKHNDYHKNMYHAYFRPVDGHWLSAAGTDLGTLIDDTVAEEHCKVFDSGALYGSRQKQEPLDIGYISKAVSASDGSPIVLFADGKRTSVVVSRWSGTEWQDSVPAPFKGRPYFNDFYAARDRSEMLVSIATGRGTIDVFRSTDDGRTWSQYGTLRADRWINLCTMIHTPRKPVQFMQEINNGDHRRAGYDGKYRVWIAVEE